MNTRPAKTIAMKMKKSSEGIGVDLRLGAADSVTNYYNMIVSY